MALPAVLALLAAAAVPVAAHEVQDAGPPGGVADPLPSGNVARVAPGLISKSSYDHWFRVAVAVRGKGTPKPGTAAHTKLRKQTMRFLISARWLELESPEHGVKVSKDQVTRALKRQKRAAFGTNEAAYRRYLKRTKRTVDDIRWQIRLSLLSRKLERYAGDDADAFADALSRKWRARTACAADYMTAECGSQAG